MLLSRKLLKLFHGQLLPEKLCRTQVGSHVSSKAYMQVEDAKAGFFHTSKGRRAALAVAAGI